MSRSYYRCTNPRCNAKKQVERSIEDPETLTVTYEGLHLHYTYSHILLSRPQNSLPDVNPHTPKKPKVHVASSEDGRNKETEQSPEARKQEQQQLSRVMGANKLQEEPPKDLVTMESSIKEEGMQQGLQFKKEESPQGLLEDIVPFLVRKPCSSPTSLNEPSLSSFQASSPSYSSTLSWSPVDFYYDIGVLSSIIWKTIR